MLTTSGCVYAKADGQPCRMAPLHDRPYCFRLDPERAAEAAEARRMGGLRRRKETTVAVAHDLPGFDTVAGIRRVLVYRRARRRERFSQSRKRWQHH